MTDEEKQKAAIRIASAVTRQFLAWKTLETMRVDPHEPLSMDAMRPLLTRAVYEAALKEFGE